MNTKTLVNILISSIWGILFILPLTFNYYLRVSEDSSFNWLNVGHDYLYLTGFLVLFAIHHFLLLPFLFQRHHIRWYSVVVTLTLACFVAFLICISVAPPSDFHHHPHHHRWILPPPDMARIVIAVLMFGVDLGIGAMVKAYEQSQRLGELEKQNLMHELESLKHQINPHFFMNTLNNIHALISIDPERAMRSVVEMSKMMRYVLYDVGEPMVKLSGEIDFIEQYISLMKLRFSKKVDIVCRMDDVPESAQIPPLLLVTFIENAFKHGISYQNESFIHVSLEMLHGDNRLRFICRNSRHEQSHALSGEGGIGLENVRKRLHLIYSDNYELIVDDNVPQQYCVTLIIPQTMNLTARFYEKQSVLEPDNFTI